MPQFPTNSSATRQQRTAIAAASAVALLCTLVPTVAEAQSGEIIVLRQVDTRNAIVPGTGDALSVKTAPDSAFFNTIQGNLRLLSDADVALVSGGKPGSAGLDGAIRFGLDSVFGTQGYGGSANSERSSGGSGTISNSISLGMGALRGALGTLRTSVPSGQ